VNELVQINIAVLASFTVDLLEHRGCTLSHSEQCKGRVLEVLTSSQQASNKLAARGTVNVIECKVLMA
jgi:hypothetical protein